MAQKLRTRVVWAVAALIAGLCGYSVSALAARSTAPRTVQLSASGSLIYSWHGDSSRGCAASGVCGVQGALIVRPIAGESSSSEGPVDVFIPVTGIARVQRMANGSPAGECVDAFAAAGGLELQVLGRGGQRTASILPGVSSGRCAGPLAADLSGVAVAVKRSGTKYPTYYMRGTRTFAAGPFTGTLDSTLVVRSAPAGGQSGGSSGFSSSSSSGIATPVPSRLVEHVDVRYRVSSVPSSLDVGFADAGDGSCGPLDTCGASGSLALSLPNDAVTIDVSASRRVGERVSSGQALADFKAGRLTLSSPGFTQLRSSMRETFSWPGTAACNDSVDAATLGLMIGSFQSPRRTTHVPVTLQNQSGVDVFRTHCPGPSDGDVVGQGPEQSNPTIARTSLSTSQLLSPRTRLALSNRGSFGGPGYAGTRSGAVVLQLTRVAVKAGTITRFG